MWNRIDVIKRLRLLPPRIHMCMIYTMSVIPRDVWSECHFTSVRARFRGTLGTHHRSEQTEVPFVDGNHGGPLTTTSVPPSRTTLFVVTLTKCLPRVKSSRGWGWRPSTTTKKTSPGDIANIFVFEIHTGNTRRCPTQPTSTRPHWPMHWVRL